MTLDNALKAVRESDDRPFVAAGVTHRFVDYRDDFVIWVVFYGPKGGE